MSSLHRSAFRRVERRLFLRQCLSLGAVGLLTGCHLEDADAVDRALFVMSRWNDRVQAALFGPNRLAPTHRPEDITEPFPFNAYYAEPRAPVIDPATFSLALGEGIADRRSWTLAELYALPQISQITRHICIEGWSAIGQWSGVRFSDFLARIGAGTKSRFVAFRCADDYTSIIDMPTALHPQTLLAFRFRDQILPTRFGFPMKLRVSTKLGFQNPKHIVAISITNEDPGGFWEKYGYNHFSGL